MNLSHSEGFISGGEIFYNRVKFGKEAGYKKVKMHCGGSKDVEGVTGYFVWPILGIEEDFGEREKIFNAINDSIEKNENEELKKKVEELLSLYKSETLKGSLIQGLYNIEGGRDFRKECGVPFDGEIVLEEDQSSYQQMKRYAESKGFK